MKLIDLANSTGVLFGTSGVRGLVASLTPKVCEAYISAFMQTVALNAKEIAVGHDLRLSSPAIARVCINTIRKYGKTPIFVGALPTPAVAYYGLIKKIPSIIITGSHIPFDRNGIKFYSSSGEITKLHEETMLQTLISDTDTLEDEQAQDQADEAKKAYLERYQSVFENNCLLGKNIAVYEHSSVGRDLLRTVLEYFGAKVVSLGRTDTFVPIDTEAVRIEDINQARVWAEKYNFDAIVSMDGDADRPLIGDETGSWLRGDVVGILSAKIFNFEAVVTPVSSNTALEKSGWFKNIIRTKIGSPYVIHKMHSISCNKIAGFEANGGFLLGTDITINNKVLKALPTRDAFLPILAILTYAAKNNLKISQLPRMLPNRFTASNRIQGIPTQVSHELIKSLHRNSNLVLKLTSSNHNSQIIDINDIDGLRFTLDSGDIVHLRPSGNAPELRCYTESTTHENASNLCDEVLRNIEVMLKTHLCC